MTKKRKIPKSLPPSNSSFWEDGEKHTGVVKVLKTKKYHKWVEKGGMAVCESCPLKHAQYLKMGTEVRGGRIVPKKPIPF